MRAAYSRSDVSSPGSGRVLYARLSRSSTSSVTSAGASILDTPHTSHPYSYAAAALAPPMSGAICFFTVAPVLGGTADVFAS